MTIILNVFIHLILLFYVIQLNFSSKTEIDDVVVSLETVDNITINNNFVQLKFNKQTGAIDRISANFQGTSSFEKNNLAQPFHLQILADGKGMSPSGDTTDYGNLESLINRNIRTVVEEIIWHVQSKVKQSFSAIVTAYPVDDIVRSLPLVTEKWTISIASNDRAIAINFEGSVLNDLMVKYIKHSILTPSTSIYGLFENGVAQMMNKKASCLWENIIPLNRVFMLGGGVAMDVIRTTAEKRPIVLVSNEMNSSDYASGIEDIIIGEYPNYSRDYDSSWSTDCWTNVKPVAIDRSMAWNYTITFVPNDYDFPVFLLRHIVSAIRSQNDMPFEELHALLTGIYASPVGCLQSFYTNQKGLRLV
jgi:hypothetical protein